MHTFLGILLPLPLLHFILYIRSIYKKGKHFIGGYVKMYLKDVLQHFENFTKFVKSVGE